MDLRTLVAFFVFAVISYTYAQDCPLDILMAVDTSSSVSRRRFVQLKEGLKLMLQNVNIQEPFANVGVCYFGTTAETIIPLTPFTSKVDINTEIDSSLSLSGRTKVSLGIFCLQDERLTSLRPEAPAVYVLVIDGNPSDPPNDAAELSATRSAIADISTDGILLIFAIGNAFTNIAEIRSWVDQTKVNTRFFSSPSFAEFRDFFSSTNAFEIPCPVDGEWSPWNSWSACSRTCGGGSRTRTRSCTNPAPADGGNECATNIDDDFDEGTCNEQPCPIDGDWSLWAPWRPCSVTCGNGVRQRVRTCNNPEPQFGGQMCPGQANDQGNCNDGPCPVDGNWSLWAPWRPCSVTCGNGVRQRDRTCNNPEPQFGGQICPGQANDQGNCNDGPCPGNGNWSPWAAWGVCSRTCGAGTRERTRECDNPPPTFGGQFCAGSPDNSGSCNLRPCPTQPPVIADCDDCIIINGIGYKDLDPCWQYLQCYFDENGQVVRAVLRTTAWGAFWNQYDINQDFPWNTDCRFEPCRNQEVGYRHPRADNCRGYWQCGPNGRTSGLFCCEEGSRFDVASQDCVDDSANVCPDACPPILPTSAGPLPCPLRLREGTDNRFYNELDPATEDMFCAATQVFDEQLCTCVNLIHDGCLPEVWIDFRNGLIADVSRNKYFIDVRGVEVDSDDGLDFYGSFDKAGKTQLIINGMASIDPGEKLAVYIRYRRNINQNFAPGAARPAILSNSDCLPLDYSYASYVNPSSSGGNAAGWVRSETGEQERQNNNENTNINEYIMEYKGDQLAGDTLMLNLNGGSAVPSTTDGPKGRVRQNSCALHVGYGQSEDNFDYFTGEIFEVRVYKCIPASYTPEAAAGLG